MKERVMFRQGDVLVVFDPVAKLPDNAKEVHPELRDGKAQIVLAHGEVTGHAHAIDLETVEGEELNVRYWDAGAERFIQVMDEVMLRHEEHAPIKLEAGVYRQAFQTEDYGTERRQVTD